MFFVLSKILYWFTSPFSWITLLATLSLFIKKESLKRKLRLTSVIILLIFSNLFILDECMRFWEVQPIPSSSLKHYNTAIVLGGFSTYDRQLHRAQFNRSTDRLLQTIDLYKSGKIDFIIFSGGSGSLLHPEEKEGIWVGQLLKTVGIPDSCYYIEPNSRNTRENALFTQEVITKKHISGPYLLVTSASHMKRSMACFDKIHLTTDPFSTDKYSGPRKWELIHVLLPSADALTGWNTLIHELVGYLSYKVVGYC